LEYWQDHPTLTTDARITHAAADRYRKLHVEKLLRRERGELTQLDQEVAQSLAEGAMVSSNTEEHYDEARTLGERLSDGLADFGGSWPFLILFGLGLASPSGSCSTAFGSKTLSILIPTS
jgi:hypothetical protein